MPDGPSQDLANHPAFQALLTHSDAFIQVYAFAATLTDRMAEAARLDETYTSVRLFEPISPKIEQTARLLHDSAEHISAAHTKLKQGLIEAYSQIKSSTVRQHEALSTLNQEVSALSRALKGLT